MTQHIDMEQFKKDLPRRTAAPNVRTIYNEDGEEVIGEKEKMKHSESLDITEVARFVNASLGEIQRLNNVYEINEVIFELNVNGNQVKFPVKFKNTTNNTYGS